MHICFKQFRRLSDDLQMSRSESIYQTIENIGPEQSIVILFATWIGQFTRFKPIFTSEGLCYTFNSLNSEEIYTNEYGIYQQQQNQGEIKILKWKEYIIIVQIIQNYTRAGNCVGQSECKILEHWRWLSVEC